MAKKGRPRALDEAKQREICALLSAGSSVPQAAKYVGCSPSTIYRASAADREFRERMRRATAMAQLAPLQAMRQAAQTHWRAAAWMLERADPSTFGRPQGHFFGAKELRALRRDLLAIFDEEIEHPDARQRIAKRVKATVDYAMRHAWDTKRSGSNLQKAMKYFDAKDQEEASFRDLHDPVGAFLASFEQSSRNGNRRSSSYAKQATDEFSKTDDYCNVNGEASSATAERNGHGDSQKG